MECGLPPQLTLAWGLGWLSVGVAIGIGVFVRGATRIWQPRESNRIPNTLIAIAAFLTIGSMVVAVFSLLGMPVFSKVALHIVKAGTAIVLAIGLWQARTEIADRIVDAWVTAHTEWTRIWLLRLVSWATGLSVLALLGAALAESVGEGGVFQTLTHHTVLTWVLIVTAAETIRWVRFGMIQLSQLLGNNDLLKPLYRWVDGLLRVSLALTAMGIGLEIWGLPVVTIASQHAPLLWKGVVVANIVLCTTIGRHFLIYFADHLQNETRQRVAAQTGHPGEAEKRLGTVHKMAKQMINIVVFTIGGLTLASALGLDIKPLLGGVGIFGVAIGLGAQGFFKDLIAGLSLILENRIRIDDVVIINGTTGTVTQINLRTIILRSLDGTVHVFSNGSVASLSNMTHEYAYAVNEVGVAYDANLDQVFAILHEIGAEMMANPDLKPLILEPIDVLGVDRLAEFSVIVKTRMKTVPSEKWNVGRELNKRIATRFHERNIDIPLRGVV